MKHWNQMAGVLSVAMLICSFTSEHNPLDKSKVVAKEKEVNGDKVIVCDFSSLPSKEIEIPLSMLTEEIQIVKLDDKEEALVGSTAAIITDNYILVKNQKQNPYKLFDKSGKFLATVGAYGEGPGEYLNVYGEAIDEKNGRIYLLPWTSTKILVYDLNGKYLKDIPLGYRVPKAKLFVDESTGNVSVVLTAVKQHPVIACTYTPTGERISPVQPGSLALPPENIYNNEVMTGKNTGEMDFSIFMFFNRRPDTLYHYDAKKGMLHPMFTTDFKNEIPIHSYMELPRHYVGDVAEEKKESENMSTTTAPRFFIIDKQTKKGGFFKLINDYMGNEEIGYPIYCFQNGYYVSNQEPASLKERIDKCLASGKKMSKQMKDKLTKLSQTINENDNNYILYAKLKK